MPEFPSHLPQGVVGLTLAPGDKVQHYTVIGLIGAGGTSAVFKAHDALLNRHVAIKQILLSPGEESDTYRARALAEADTHKRAAAADPAMLVQLIDVVSDPRGILLITEFVDGPSLEQILQVNPAPMEERQAMGILAGAAKGLASLHAAGILHRDLKPANILMPRSGGLRLVDFGLSASIHSAQLMDQGTMRYLAPEVLQDQPASPASDLYALGMIAYEMLAGRAQYEEAFKAILRDQRNQAMRWVKWHTNPKIKAAPLAQLNPTLSPAVLELVERLMDKDPLRRINSAHDLLNAIRTIVTVASSPAYTDGAPPPGMAQQGAAFPTSSGAAPTARIPKRKKWPLVAASMGLLLVTGAFVATELNKKTPPSSDQLVRAHVLELMNKAEAAWQTGDAMLAMSIFEKMQEGGTDARPAGTTSRTFADAGAAKCKVRLAINQKRYNDAATELELFEKLATALDNDKKFPPSGLTITQRLQSEIAHELHEELDPRKRVADALALMKTLLKQGKNSECMTECNDWLARANTPSSSARAVVLADERAQIEDLRAQCSLSGKELALQKLMDEARKNADAGDAGKAVELLTDEIKISGETADPRIKALLTAIQNDAQFKALEARYRKAETLDEKISLLSDILAMRPDFADKGKLGPYQAQQCLENAKQSVADGDFPKAGQLIAKGLKLDPKNQELLTLKDLLARQLTEAKLLDEANSLFSAREWEKAQLAYEKVLGNVRNKKYIEEADEKIILCKGNAKLAKAQAMIKANDLIGAKIMLGSAEKDLPESPEVAAGFEQIAQMQTAQQLAANGNGAFNRQDYAGAVPAYMKLVAFLKEHPAAGDLDAGNERLRICRFEDNINKCMAAMGRKEWSSANGFLGVANSHAKTEEEKVRVKKLLTILRDAPNQ